MAEVKTLEWLNEQIQRIEERQRVIEEYLQKLQQERDLLLSLPEICPTCKGTGEEYYTREQDVYQQECLTCKGLDKIGTLKCHRCARIVDTQMIHVRRLWSDAPQCPWCGGDMEYVFDAVDND